MENLTCADPVAKLLTLGCSPAQRFTWPNFLQMGLSNEHIPERIILMQDFELANQPGIKTTMNLLLFLGKCTPGAP
jgi:hypothetical protein